MPESADLQTFLESLFAVTRALREAATDNDLDGVGRLLVERERLLDAAGLALRQSTGRNPRLAPLQSAIAAENARFVDDLLSKRKGVVEKMQDVQKQKSLAMYSR